MGIYAAKNAIVQARWREKNFDIICGCSRGPTETWEMAFRDKFIEKNGLRPQTSPLTTLGSLGFAIADFFGQTGLAASQSVTCSSGFHALIHAIALLRAGMSERVLVGGSQAPLTTFTIAQLKAMRILARKTDDQFPCRPLSNGPPGMSIGEGAALFCLSTEDDANSNYELIGIGYANEIHPSLSGISRDGQALGQAMQKALKEADCLPDLIIPHAPGTKAGDLAELKALQRVFGTDIPPIYSGKWATGHTFGASGPLGLDLALTILEEQKVPRLPYPLRPQLREWNTEEPLETIMVNSTGFGGNAVSLVVRRVTN
jgi:3-oxoacyl-(acyl-carrier-protein) synthase